MIHVENITINIQPTGAEAGPTSVLGDALMKAMAESIFAEQPEQPEELDSEVEVQPPINPARMNSLQQQADDSLQQQADDSLRQQADDSLQQQADAWKVVCATLNEVCQAGAPAQEAQHTKPLPPFTQWLRRDSTYIYPAPAPAPAPTGDAAYGTYAPPAHHVARPPAAAQAAHQAQAMPVQEQDIPF